MSKVLTQVKGVIENASNILIEHGKRMYPLDDERLPERLVAKTLRTAIDEALEKPDETAAA